MQIVGGVTRIEKEECGRKREGKVERELERKREREGVRRGRGA